MTKLSEKLLQAGFPEPHHNSAVAKALYNSPVGNSTEFERVTLIPRRKLIVSDNKTVTLEWADKKENVPDLTPVFSKRDGRMILRPLQNASLWECFNNNGGFLMLGVGEGKTLVALLLAEAMNSKCAVLLVKPELVSQLINTDIPLYKKHFNLPLNRIYVVPYSMLSSAKHAETLEKLKPDLIIADEAHKLRTKSSARTRRFLRFMKKNPDCRFVALSGSFMKRSIQDYAHLIELALKERSPLPRNYKDLEEWAEALDIADDPRPPGVLAQFCKAEENVREGFRNRLRETPGVVASEEMSVPDISLIIAERKLKLPDTIKKALEKLYETWESPNGEEELSDAMSLNRVARQIICGFYYKWDWNVYHKGIKDEEWVRAKRAWNKEVRNRLLHTSIPGMDSELLLFNAANEGRWHSETFHAWNMVRHRPKPPVIPIWLDFYMVEDAIKWGQERLKDKGGIIWYESTAVGELIGKASGWNVYGEGVDASLVDKSKEKLIVCSLNAQSEGKNLQAWNRGLITSPMANGVKWEQTLGRMHRPGQMEDEVIYDLYLHSKEFKNALDQSIEDAKYKESQEGKQRLLAAQIIREEI